jgi:hypothetical protein
MHLQKTGVWCETSSGKVVGPLFCEKAVNAEAYLSIIMQLCSLLQFLRKKTVLFQKNSTTCLATTTTMNMLKEFFGYRTISEGLCPPGSPDFVFFKENVYQNNPRSIQLVKVNTENAIGSIIADNPTCVYQRAVDKSSA